MGTLVDFQSAIWRALQAEPTLTALVSTRIFDDTPHESETTSTVFPRVTIGEQTGREDGSDTHDAIAISITIHAWSRAAGRKECLNILSAINTALHNKSHAVATGLIVFLLYDEHETQREPDGETSHGIIRFSGLLQYG